MRITELFFLCLQAPIPIKSYYNATKQNQVSRNTYNFRYKSSTHKNVANDVTVRLRSLMAALPNLPWHHFSCHTPTNNRTQIISWNYETANVSRSVYLSLLHAYRAWFELLLFGGLPWETSSADISNMWQYQPQGVIVSDWFVVCTSLALSIELNASLSFKETKVVDKMTDYHFTRLDDCRLKLSIFNITQNNSILFGRI